MTILTPVERLYRAINRVRRSLHRRGVLDAERLPRPVISIGNRTIGGSGKTPTVIVVAAGLRERGVRPAILTRGYRRSSTEEPLLVDAPRPERFGDEPVLIANALPDVPVIVGIRRARAARWFLERADCDVFLLDDGFQHLRLARDVDVVLEPSHAAWYREGPEALRDADAILVRGEPPAVRAEVPRFTAVLRPVGWIAEGESRALEALRGRPAVAFAGLADNAQFFATLEALGVELRARIEFRDHHRYRSADLAAIADARRRTGVDLVLTTEKDLVKLPGEGLGALRVAMEIEPREEFFSLLVRRIREFRPPPEVSTRS